jgi:hypothetical protein
MDVRSQPPARWPLVRRLLVGVRILRVRLRFVFVFIVAFLIVGKWSVLRIYWDRITRRAASLDTTRHAVSLDTEYFCPMDPGVISGWSGKCGICNMALVRRKKGEMVQLPEGVVARMQLSPYRVQLAGIETSPVSFRPLEREIVTIGRVLGLVQPEAATGVGEPVSAAAVVSAEVFQRDMLFVAEGQWAEVSSDADLVPTCSGKVGSIDRKFAADSHVVPVRIDLDNVPRGLRTGLTVTVRIRVPAADIEPFCSMPRSAPPPAPDSVRVVFGCPEHWDVLRTEPGRCPLDRNELERRQLTGNQRVDWWCPMHPNVTSQAAGAQCRECDGMKLLPRVVSFTPIGEVLAVPESAVIDTGTKKVVYVERSPGVFDGIEVALGPRFGDAYPVIRGLEPGQRVAATGAFLIDAETRLNPSIAASYFGATTASSPPTGVKALATGEPDSVAAKASTQDAKLVAEQKVCPVSNEPLGSMGLPVRVDVNGTTVFLCCKGCEAELRENSEKYLSKLSQLRP